MTNISDMNTFYTTAEKIIAPHYSSWSREIFDGIEISISSLWDILQSLVNRIRHVLDKFNNSVSRADLPIHQIGQVLSMTLQCPLPDFIHPIYIRSRIYDFKTVKSFVKQLIHNNGIKTAYPITPDIIMLAKTLSLAMRPDIKPSSININLLLSTTFQDSDMPTYWIPRTQSVHIRPFVKSYMNVLVSDDTIYKNEFENNDHKEISLKVTHIALCSQHNSLTFTFEQIIR